MSSLIRILKETMLILLLPIAVLYAAIILLWEIIELEEAAPVVIATIIVAFIVIALFGWMRI